ncbi:MAG: CPBP family intramembrane metalloprotease [Clostridiales bacterium]|nr:CPBP family intramembrane metalloprotease [Clostridiales bacterium]
MQDKLSQENDLCDRPKWKIWHSFAILVFIVILESALYLFKESVMQPGGLMLIGNMLQFACFLLFPLYIAGIHYKQSPQVLGIQNKPFFMGLGKGLSWGASLYILQILAANLLWFIFPDLPMESQSVVTTMLTEGKGIELFGIIISIIVLAPVGEEIFFRAFMMGALQARFGRLAGVLISALVFAAMHFEATLASVWIVFPLFVGGCGFGILYAKYQDISLNIISHATWNSIALILLFANHG